MQLLPAISFKFLCKRLCLPESYPATGCTAGGADKAAFLINQCLVAAIRAFLTFGCGAVRNVFLQGTFHAVFPGIDVLAVQLQ